MGKEQPGERQLGRGADWHVVVQGELLEGVVRRGGICVGEESTPEVKPASVVRADIVKHRQQQCWSQEGLEWEIREERSPT